MSAPSSWHGSRAATSPRPALRHRRDAGQGIIEFAAVLPVFLVFLLGMLEFGTVFNHNISIEYATREGVRQGAALGNGGGVLGCGVGQSPDAGAVDPSIIQAVERVLTSPGSPVVMGNINEIRIYRATAAGLETPGLVNVWTWTPGAGPAVADNKTPLDFSLSGKEGWPACSRVNTNPPDAIGVSISYSYRFLSGLSDLTASLGAGNGPSVPITDRTVMALNPTAP